MNPKNKNQPLTLPLFAGRMLLPSVLLASLITVGTAQADTPVKAKDALPPPAATSAAAAPSPEAYVPTEARVTQPAAAGSPQPKAPLEYVQPEAPESGKVPADAAPWPGFQRTTASGASGTEVELSSEQLYYMEITHHAMPAISTKQRQAFEHDIVRAARETRVRPALIRAVITAESSYDPTRVSPKGAVGLMQVLPDTAQRFGVRDVYTPSENIKAGSRYLAFLLRVFNNDVKLALAAYNAGEQAVIRHGNQVPPYRETINYVPRVLRFYEHYLRHPLKTDF